MQSELVFALAGGLAGGVLLVVVLVAVIGQSRARYRALLFATTALTFVVVVVGAYVRLSDAGLGCPDWPGCYGHMDVPRSLAERAAADARYPTMPVDVAKGWKEMGHRYIAGLLGLLIAALAIAAVRMRHTLARSPIVPVALVAIVAVQALLGKWTVTLLLKPVIVTLHLVGGMTILALLTWLCARELVPRYATRPIDPGLRVLAALALVLVAVQIVLGGWVSTNYAALACPDLPLCRGALMPPMDFENAFHVLRPLGQTAAGELLSNEALTAIHWMHRAGAIVVATFCLYLGAKLVSSGANTALGLALVAAVLAQFAIGVGNIVWSLPLALAAAHNAGAAALLMVVVVLNYRLAARSSAAPAAVRLDARAAAR